MRYPDKSDADGGAEYETLYDQQQHIDADCADGGSKRDTDGKQCANQR